MEALSGSLRRDVVVVGTSAGGVETLTVPAVTRRGRHIDCHVNVLPLVVGGREVRGAILLMEPVAEEPPS